MLGAKVIEKHFTDNNNRKGPDHYFSMNPKTWSEMVEQTRILERSLGDGVKRVEENELRTNFIQRRGSYEKKEKKKKTLINKDDIIFLRPNFRGSISPFLGKKKFGKSKKKIHKGEFVFSR